MTADEALIQHTKESWFSIPDSRDYETGFLRGHRYATAAPRVRQHRESVQCTVADLGEPVDVHFEFDAGSAGGNDEPAEAPEVTIDAVYMRGVDIFHLLDEERREQLVTDILAQREEALPVRRRA